LASILQRTDLMKTVLALCFCGLSLHLFAQQSPLSFMRPVDSQPRAYFVTSGGSSLKWIGQTFTEEDQLKEVELQNVSTQTVTGFQLAWVVFVPEGCGVTEPGVARKEFHLAPYETRSVKPGETVAVGPYHFSADSITNLARHAHSPAVVAQIGLYRVRSSKTGEMISGVEQMGAFGPEAVTHPCQSTKKQDPDMLRVFVGPQDSFQFQYSQILVHCTESEKQQGLWEPDASCEAYMPICDDGGSQGSHTLACFAYPREKFEDTPTFGGSAFVVAEIKQANDEKTCLNGSPDWVIDPRGSGGTKTVGGVDFKAFETDGAAMSHSFDGEVYRAFYKKKCYELAIRTAMTNPGAYDPGTINDFTKEDSDEIHGRLEQALESFRFLK
jgi:hypothetical protein